MAVAIKRVIQFSYAKMNSVQSEQTRISAENKYKNDHICEEFKKFNIHPINNTEGLTYNQYFKKYCKRRTGGKKKVDVVSEMGKKDFYLVSADQKKISLKPLILLCFLLKDGIIKCTVLTDLKSFFVQFSIEKYHLRSGK